MLALNGIIITGLTYFILNDRAWKATSEERMLRDGKTVLRTEQFIDKVYDTSTNEYKYFKHITDPGIHMPKEAKDSIYVTRKEFDKYQQQQNREVFRLLNRLSRHEEKANEIMDEMRADQKIMLNYLKELSKKLGE